MNEGQEATRHLHARVPEGVLHVPTAEREDKSLNRTGVPHLTRKRTPLLPWDASEGGGCALGPLGFDFAQHRQTLRPPRRRDPQQSPASFRIAVKDLEDPAVQCRRLAVSV